MPEPFTDYFDQNIGRFLSSNYTLILYKSRETESGIFEKKNGPRSKPLNSSSKVVAISVRETSLYFKAGYHLTVAIAMIVEIATGIKVK